MVNIARKNCPLIDVKTSLWPEVSTIAESFSKAKCLINVF